MLKIKKILLGQIVAAHGIKGLLKVRTFTETPESLVSYGQLLTDKNSKINLKITQIKSQESVLVQVEGCTTRTDAEGLIGTKLYINHDQLPSLTDDEFYYSDLIGMQVVDESGVILGRVLSVQNYGAGDFLDVALSQNSKTATLAFNKDSIARVDRTEGKIYTLPEFLLI